MLNVNTNSQGGFEWLNKLNINLSWLIHIDYTRYIIDYIQVLYAE